MVPQCVLWQHDDMHANKWQFGVGEPQHLVLALYVRDAAGLTPAIDPVIPPLRPAVAARPELVQEGERAAVTGQWESWWQHLWSIEDVARTSLLPEHVPDVGKHALHQVVQALWSDAQEYCAARKQEHIAYRRTMRLPHQTPEASVLATATRRRGLRRRRPVRLRVSELPVATAQGWHRRPGHVVVTRPLHHDVEAYQRWLRPVVEQLAEPA